MGAARGGEKVNTYLLLGALRNRNYRWVSPELDELAAEGIAGADTMPDEIGLSEASVLSGIPEHVLNDANACERIKLPGRAKGARRFSRLALVAWCAVNDPAARLGAWGAERARGDGAG